MYDVTATIQSPDNPPVETRWYRGDDLARAIAAFASAVTQDTSGDRPEFLPRTLRVTLGVDSAQSEHNRTPLPEAHQEVIDTVLSEVDVNLMNADVTTAADVASDVVQRLYHQYRVIPYDDGEPGPLRAEIAQPTAPPLIESRPDGDYFTGDIEAAKRLLVKEYDGDIAVIRNLWSDREEKYTVEEFRGGLIGNPNQWGCGKTEEEAWRYLAGADFGPVDEEYDEARLREALNQA